MSDKAIEMLANKLGVASDQILQVFVDQAALVPWIEGIRIVVCLLIFSFCLGLYHYFKRKGDEFIVFVASIGVAMSVMVMVVVALFGSHEIITAIYNPHAWAIKEILRSIGK